MKTNLPKENRILYRFNAGIVQDIGKAKRKLIPQKKTKVANYPVIPQ